MSGGKIRLKKTRGQRLGGGHRSGVHLQDRRHPWHTLLGAKQEDADGGAPISCHQGIQGEFVSCMFKAAEKWEKSTSIPLPG